MTETPPPVDPAPEQPEPAKPCAGNLDQLASIASDFRDAGMRLQAAKAAADVATTELAAASRRYHELRTGLDQAVQALATAVEAVQP